MKAHQFAPAALAIAAIGLPALRAQAKDARAETTAALQLNVVVSGSAETLQAADVQLLDNGAPVPSSSLHLQTGGGQQHVILVVDDVNAPLTTVAYERDQLKRFFTARDGQLAAPFTLAVMTDQKTEIQPGFSQSGAEENQALQKYRIGLHEIRRDSQYGGFDRTDICIRSLEQLVQYAATLPGHKLILFVSPGWPLLSGPRIELSNQQEKAIYQTVAHLQDAMVQSDITLDMLNPIGPAESPLRSDYYLGFLKGVRKPSDTDLADLSLQVLATHSGGTVQQGTSDITGMVERSVSNLSHSLTLAFTPPAQDSEGTYHSLKLQVNRPGITVRMPDEYYTQTPSASDTAH